MLHTKPCNRESPRCAGLWGGIRKGGSPPPRCDPMGSCKVQRSGVICLSKCQKCSSTSCCTQSPAIANHPAALAFGVGSEGWESPPGAIPQALAKSSVAGRPAQVSAQNAPEPHIAHKVLQSRITPLRWPLGRDPKGFAPPPGAVPWALAKSSVQG